MILEWTGLFYRNLYLTFRGKGKERSFPGMLYRSQA